MINYLYKQILNAINGTQKDVPVDKDIPVDSTSIVKPYDYTKAMSADTAKRFFDSHEEDDFVDHHTGNWCTHEDDSLYDDDDEYESEECGWCNGTGYQQDFDTECDKGLCPNCGGDGIVYYDRNS